MAETCPHLDYRDESDDHSFETARAYCTIAEEFVQPMRADICNRRHGLDPETDCEIYISHEQNDSEVE